MTGLQIRTIVDWLADGARSAPMPDMVLAQLCDRLVGCGIPLWRVAVFVRTLHPEVVGRRFIWQLGAEVEVGQASFDILDTAEFRNSPIAAVASSATTIRRRLDDANCPDDFPVLAEFRADGITDYLATPLIFTDGAVHVATWATRQPGGFTEEQIAGLEAIIAPLARVAEIRAMRRTAGNLLDTYVGSHAGERILAGQIRRGHTETIHAVIWLSDMRGFTTMADRLPPQILVDLLNRYFDCQVPAIIKSGGQVLKFIGDGLLAIFPIAKDGSDTREVCRRAVAAALESRANIEALDATNRVENVAGLRFGLALHVGHVLYGNIGSGNRLDFTCIGPAVNLAARLEALAGRLGCAVVASAEFARHCPDSFEPLGEFTIAGFAAPQMAHSLRAAKSSSSDPAIQPANAMPPA